MGGIEEHNLRNLTLKLLLSVQFKFNDMCSYVSHLSNGDVTIWLG